jgi:polar amino acid transport system substrate-binding protein
MPDLTSLTRGRGVLRAAINTGNRALVQFDGTTLGGISPALARRLAASIDARLESVVYDGAGKVFEDAANDLWDVAFLAVDPKRAEKVSFTRPYVTIEATYAVRVDGKVQDLLYADQKGVRILTAKGSAYDLYLTKMLQQARLERLGTPPESFEAFRNGSWDAVAGVRASLEAAFGDDPSIRILPGALTKVEQAMVLPGAHNPVIEALDAFVAEAVASGFVAEHWDR